MKLRYIQPLTNLVAFIFWLPMYSYNQLFEMCDLVLALFITRETRLTDDDIHSSLKDKNLTNLRTAIQQLVTDGCIEKDNAATGNWYVLKGKGSHIYEMGGFREHFKELKRKDELKEILDQYQIDTSKSVIKTNGIVQDNVKSQERLTKLTFAVAAASVIVSIIALVKPQQLVDTETQQTLNRQVQVLDSLRQSVDSVRYQLSQKPFSQPKDTSQQKDTKN